MFGELSALLSVTERARLGALGLHLAVGLIFLSMQVSPIAPDPIKTVSIELVDVSALDPEEIAPVEQPPEEVPPIQPEPDPAPPTEAEPAPQVPIREPDAQIAIAPAAPAPPRSTAILELETEDEEDAINPAFLIRRDPFAEIAPPASARVSASVMCARTNRETRPAFCPEIDDEDIRFAALARVQGDLGGYSPRDETLFAQVTLDRVARSNRYERLVEGQQSLDEFASTGASPVRQLGLRVPRHAEGLKNCTPVRTGIARVGGGVDGLSTELTNGSEVFCD